MDNEELDRKLYKYPQSEVLKNRWGIRDPEALRASEQEAVQQRLEEPIPTGNFDLDHLQSIHRHLFQDVYEWAGEIRQTDFHKGGEMFHPYGAIATGMLDIHRRLSQQNYLRDLDREKFAEKAGEIIGDVNRLHPFREGNGRTQLQYLKLLGERAGHEVDLDRLEQESWIEASKAVMNFESGPMSNCIRDTLIDREHEREKSSGGPEKDAHEPKKEASEPDQHHNPSLAPEHEEIQEPGIAVDQNFDKDMER